MTSWMVIVIVVGWDGMERAQSLGLGELYQDLDDADELVQCEWTDGRGVLYRVGAIEKRMTG